MNRPSPPPAQPAPRSLLHDAVDVNLRALCEAHRRLARAPAEFFDRSGALTPQIAALNRWQEAMLRTGYFSLIAANRFAGALAVHWLAARPHGTPPPR
jgi:hypothetical protein